MSETAITLQAEASAPVAQLADCSPAQFVEQRYLAAVETLLDDAIENQTTEILVDVLAWNLARIGSAHGPAGLADIFRRVGGHACEIVQRIAAEREAEAARKAGHQPN
jgi:hypothetical protein